MTYLHEALKAITFPLTELVNVDEELAKMEKEEKRLEGEVERAEKKLSNQGFVAHAPEDMLVVKIVKLDHDVNF